jgi:hypothetical protein
LYSREPFTSKRTRNLLPKDDWRTALRDEAAENRPEVALVTYTLALPRGAEGLAGATSSPHSNIIWPSGESESVGPPPDAGEEVRLRVPREIRRFDIGDAPLVYVAVGDQARLDEFAEPCRGLRVILVVVGRH